jgi:hypothetical protein
MSTVKWPRLVASEIHPYFVNLGIVSSASNVLKALLVPANSRRTSAALATLPLVAIELPLRFDVSDNAIRILFAGGVVHLPHLPLAHG